VSQQPDPVEEWSAAQRRVIELVAPLAAEQAQLRVPSCPDWTVRDLFSHMVGLGSDVVAGDEPDDHNEAWTARQVAQRRDHDIAALVAEWEATAAPLVEWMRVHGPRPLGDVIIHEQDLRGALGVPGGQYSVGVAIIRDRFAARFSAALPGGASVALSGDHWTWGDPATAGTVLQASDFDLARALVTRRSAAQLRAWTVRGDVEPYLGAFALLGSLPAADLTE
jgi:uncharacterized protein (TIGR03083 family)